MCPCRIAIRVRAIVRVHSRSGHAHGALYDKKKIGSFDLIVSCRVLEHSYDIFKLIKNLKKLLNRNGEFIFEVPDSYKSLKQGDIGMLWEEHPVYLTKNSIEIPHFKRKVLFALFLTIFLFFLVVCEPK